MKRTLLTVGAALALLPFFSADARANHDVEFVSIEPTILLRCQQTHSTTSYENYSFEEEQSEQHTFHHESFSDRHARQSSHIRDLLRQRPTNHSPTNHRPTNHRPVGSIASVPIVIEIQGDCDAIRVGSGAEPQDELFPGEFDHLSDYEAWQETRRGHTGSASRLWLTRPGSGWDWFLRRRGNSIRYPAYPSQPVPRDK